MKHFNIMATVQRLTILVYFTSAYIFMNIYILDFLFYEHNSHKIDYTETIDINGLKKYLKYCSGLILQLIFK